MAKKTAATRTRSRTARPGRTSAATDTPAGTARSTRTPHAGAASSDRTTSADVIGAASELPKPAKLVSSPGRPDETQLTVLQREKETALATGQEQPHPTMAPRAGATSPDNGPVGRAHQPRRVGDGQAPKGAIKVMATRMGEYLFRRRRKDDVFFLIPIPDATVTEPVLETEGPNKGKPKTNRNGRVITHRVVRTLTPEEQFSERWMVKVDEQTPLKESTSGDVLKTTANGARSRPSDADVI